MPFEKTSPTPSHLLTAGERQLRSKAEQLDLAASAFVDEIEEEMADSPLTVDPVADQTETLQLDLAGASEVKPTEEELDAKAKAAAEADRKLRREHRLAELKARQELTDLRTAFLLEISGITSLSKSYSFGGMITAVFETTDSATLQMITQQATFDILSNRIISKSIYGSQHISGLYRLASCLKSLTIVDPDTGVVKKQYLRDELTGNKLGEGSPEIHVSDSLVRRRWINLSTKVLTTQTLNNVVMDWFSSFEMLQNDLLELMELDPSFFTDTSSTTG